MPRFEHRFEVDHPVGEVFEWHQRPGALVRLTPPWESVRVVRASGGLEVGSRAVLEIRRGPVTLSWEVEHTEFEAGRRFVDTQVRGPLSHWTHEHRFEPVGPARTLVEDVVEWGAPMGSLGDAFSERFIARALGRLFAFRARRLQGDLTAHRKYGPGDGRVVAITGSTGLVGRALTAFLTAGGYRVLGISRSSRSAEGWIRWDPERGELPKAALEGVHAVVHLAGESIAGMRWTSAKKEAILRSREEGTLLLSRTLAELQRPPEVLVSASGVHFYGNRGEERLTEASESGEGFLAEVCRRWEAATHAARAIGIRTVLHRSGPVISPEGGMLGAMLLPFRMGLGGRVGSGGQYTSWIDLDDTTTLIHHAIRERRVRGPLNSAAPAPVPNAALTDILGRVLGRPTLLPVPAFAIQAALGEMGKELLLFGQRVVPEKALETGFEFQFTDLEDSLRHQLGESGDDGETEHGGRA